MTFSAHVEGGTGAGSKRPLLPAYTIPWTCKCDMTVPACPGGKMPEEFVTAKLNPGYLKKCIDCGTSRDSA